MKKRLVLPFLPLLFAATLAHAQTVRYVSNNLEVPLRAGASAEQKIVGSLSGGAAIEVLRTDAANGYTLVRADGDLQGWIPSQYLVDIPDARSGLAGAQRAIEAIEAENARLKERLQNLINTEDGKSGFDYQKLNDENQQLRQELARLRKTSERVVAIDEQNRNLQERTIELERELQIVQQENQALAESNQRHWFLVGAGVLFAGVFLGLIAVRLRPPSQRRWKEL